MAAPVLKAQHLGIQFGGLKAVDDFNMEIGESELGAVVRLDHVLDGLAARAEALERQADERGIQPLLDELARVDPESAARLHPSDRRRIIRALEIYQETGETITEHDRRTRLQPPKYRPAWLGMTFRDRADLYERIDRRVELMMQEGLADEVRALLDAGVPETATAMQAIGYKELTDALRGGPLDEAVRLIQQRSRNYAKRQLTWFRRNPEIFWLEQTLPLDFSAVFESALHHIPFFAEK